MHLNKQVIAAIIATSVLFVATAARAEQVYDTCYQVQIYVGVADDADHEALGSLDNSSDRSDAALIANKQMSIASTYYKQCKDVPTLVGFWHETIQISTDERDMGFMSAVKAASTIQLAQSRIQTLTTP